MAQVPDKAVVVAELENYLKGVARHFLERVYGPDDRPWGTKFADLEDVAGQLGQAVSQNLIEQAVARQAATVPPDAETCRGCGQPVTPPRPPNPGP